MTNTVHERINCIQLALEAKGSGFDIGYSGDLLEMAKKLWSFVEEGLEKEDTTPEPEPIEF